MKWKCGNQSQPERGGKRIAAWPAILFAPPLSTRFYAINFVYIPELQWQFGHPRLSVRWSRILKIVRLSYDRSSRSLAAKSCASFAS